MGSVNKTEQVEICITTEDILKLSKKDQDFSEESGDYSLAYVLVAKEHGYRIVGFPPRTGCSKLFSVVKL